MQAIIPNRPTRVLPYAWDSISVNPDPPRVGEVTKISFPLMNPGRSELVVERIDVQIARFGMGVRWEQLRSLGPFRLPADSRRVEEIVFEWTPKEGGHRCVRAAIHVRGMATPLQVARNLNVIHCAEHEELWRVPFRLGNPERQAAPIVLRLGGGDYLSAGVRIEGRPLQPAQPIWLAAGQEVDAELVVHAHCRGALAHARTVEAYIHDRFIDGIQVRVERGALRHLDLSDAWVHAPEEAGITAVATPA